MASNKSRIRAGQMMSKAIQTDEGTADTGDWAQGEEGKSLQDHTSTGLYTSMRESGDDLANQFTGGGGFRTTAISEGYVGRLSLNRQMLTGQFGKYADKGQKARGRQGRTRNKMTAQRERMRQGERGETMGYLNAIGAGAQAGMNYGPDQPTKGNSNVPSWMEQGVGMQGMT